MRPHALALALLPLAAAVPAAEKPTPQAEIIRLTNEFRKAQKLPPLKEDPRLSRAAQKHAENMARQGKIAHILDGKALRDRVKAEGYKFVLVGENVAQSHDEGRPQEFLLQWKESTGHRANMLRALYREIGVGLAKSKSGVWYACQVFGVTQAKFSATIRNATRQDLTCKFDQPPAFVLEAGRKVALPGVTAEISVTLHAKPPLKPLPVTFKNGRKYVVRIKAGALLVDEE